MSVTQSENERFPITTMLQNEKLPYAWGKFCGVVSAVMTLYYLCQLVLVSDMLSKLPASIPYDLFQKIAIFSYTATTLLASVYLVAAVGLLRKKRYGVVALYLGGILGAAVVLYGAHGGDRASVEAVPRLLYLPVGWVINFLYFKKRWPEMGQQPEPAALENQPIC
jgi:hypothetical protein